MNRIELLNDSHRIDGEIWFIPMDITMIIATLITISLGLLLLITVINNPMCRTVSTMLVCNSCIVGIFFACVMLSMTSFTLQNDLKQIIYEDSLCTFRGYLDYLAAALQNHSFALHAIYRYVSVVYPSYRLWRTVRFQIVLVLLKWILLSFCFLPLFLNGEIRYNANNQICQIPLRFSFPIIYVTLLVFLVPMLTIIVLYFKLLQYVQRMSKNIARANRFLHAKRQLKMVHRIFILIHVLLLLGLPYTTFIFISFVSELPKYHFRIIFIFVYLSSILVMIALFYCTKTIQRAMITLLGFSFRTLRSNDSQAM